VDWVVVIGHEQSRMTLKDNLQAGQRLERVLVGMRVRDQKRKDGGEIKKMDDEDAMTEGETRT